MFDFNLQLFADEEVESGGYEGEEEVEEKKDLEEIEEEDLDGDEDELEDDLDDDLDDEDNPSLDKKTKAIIKHKKEAKALKKQLEDVNITKVTYFKEEKLIYIYLNHI